MPPAARWHLPEVDPQLVADLSAACTLPLPIAQLLVRRNILTADDARHFLHSTLEQLHDPFLMQGMHEAVDRILQAIVQREPILIYGDYDVDGTTATVLLKTAIDRITPRQNGSEESLVRFHIPHRILEGYGMQTGILAGAAESGIRLVISVDTGIRAFAAARECQAQKMDLIVTDHHLPDDSGVPEAIAVLNPNQDGDTYPYKELCGAGVAFKLAHALLLSVSLEDSASTTFRHISATALEEKFLPSFLKLLSIATIADSVALTGENRAIVALGLEQLRQPNQPGLRSLMQLSGFNIEKNAVVGDFTARDVAFRIAPRINAAGRMDTASDVVDLFLTRDSAQAQAIAQKLHQLNTERRETEAQALEVLEAQIAKLRETDPELESHGILVLDGEGWHRGVVGILASRVVERTGRPALVVATEEGTAHGSGRSIAGFHLLNAITAVDNESALFTRFGGHAFAVGFSLPAALVPELRARLSAYAAPLLTASVLAFTVEIDAELHLDQIDSALYATLKRCEPFGNSNPEPIFASFGVTICEPVRALKERHAKLHVRQQADAPAIAVLCWARTEAWPERLESLGITQGSIVDIAYRLRENTHPDFGSGIELELCEIRLTERQKTSE